jgi:two-component system, NarL family, sensor kinase
LKTARAQAPARPAPSTASAGRRSRLPGRGHSRLAEAAAVANTAGLADLRARLAETEDMLGALRGGDVDALVVAGKRGPQVFTLQGADHAYRLLIESMNEGALTLTSDKTILYSNQCFARMVRCPLEQVLGSSFRRFLSAGDRTALRSLLKRPDESGSKIQLELKAGDGSRLPAQISIRLLPKHRHNGAIFGMVVTDLTESQRTGELLRALSHRAVEAQEAERGRVALELHDNITQPLCAILFRCQALAKSVPARNWPARSEAMKLHEMLGQTAEEVERISRNLRPSVLDQLGLVAVLRHASTEFADRTGVSVKLACAPLAERLPAAIELALYRIFQEALRNVENHARARHASVALRRRGTAVQLVIKDDGIGFDSDRRPAGRNPVGHLGLLGMRERAGSVGGALRIRSVRCAGTEIAALIPLPAGPDASPRD